MARRGGVVPAMWVVMMVAMMLPSLVPTLWRYRQAGLGPMTALVGVGYFRRLDRLRDVSLFGRRRAAAPRPRRGRVVVLMAGLLQFTAWKARHLACCRDAVRAAGPPGNTAEPRLHCSQCCSV